jgi:tetratricopeptide (TPR) repeat protein
MPSDSVSHRDLRLKYDCYDNLSMPDSALAYGRIIADKYIYDSENIANIAGYFNSIDQSDSALIYTKRYLDVDSTNMFVNRQHAYAYYNGKKFQKAMEEYARLINMGDSSLFTTFRMGLCCNGCDSLEKAFPYFLKAGKLSNFQNPNILTQLGKSCIVVGRVDDGIEYLSQALSTAYRSLDVLFILNSSLADGYFNKHDYRLTISHLKQALTYNNASYATLFKLGQAYELNNQMKEAKLTYQSLHETLANIDHPSASVTSLLKLCDERLFLISKMNLK